ncbi:hypothetical protein ANN_27079 [Periplaneta americana]|uniref:DUF4817 domain-containing protein n=1 Tax=Periplaneta americana TaxID=6978 RepID=A0ABQ8RX08_PERAM|nr:hypothetical protein ANN_27079 [Periplaneta americana]
MEASRVSKAEESAAGVKQNQDLAPCDFWLFPKLKTPLKGSHFESREEIMRNATTELNTIPKEDFQRCFRQWKDRWAKSPNEEAMLERALAMSLEGGEEEQSTPAVPDFAHMTEEEQIAFAMQMSMQDAREGYIQCCVGVRLCDMYSNQELAEINFMYGKADGNAALARRLYQERYPQRQCPDRKTFVRLHYRLCEYGKFNSPGLGRGRPRSTTPEVQEAILEAVNMTPSISTRRVALQVNVPHTTVWRLLKEYQLHPYHFQRVQALSPADYPARVRRSMRHR